MHPNNSAKPFNIFEMLFIKELNPKLNTEKDSIHAKLFT